MKLSKENTELVINWLNEKCGKLRCTACGNSKWEIAQANIVLGFNPTTTRFHYHDGLPVVSLACGNCGHIEMFSSGIMGIKPEPIAEENIENKEN
jgi:hypothetical protein